jgi:hypothetical protein
MAYYVYVGDTGTEIKIDIGEDLTNATILKIKYKKPNGVTGEWVASRDANNPLKMVYVTQSDDLDVAGPWILQPYVEFAGWKGHGTIVRFEVYEPIG